MSCSCDSCTPVPLPCETHNPPGGSTPPGKPSVPTLALVTARPQTLRNANSIMLQFHSEGTSFLQVLWGQKGQPKQQYKQDNGNEGAAFTFEPTEPGTTYSFNAQGCIDQVLAPANCSPWSVEASITAVHNLNSVVKFIVENFGAYSKPSKNYPMSLRWLLTGSVVVPYGGDPNTPYYLRRATARAVLGV